MLINVYCNYAKSHSCPQTCCTHCEIARNNHMHKHINNTRGTESCVHYSYAWGYFLILDSSRESVYPSLLLWLASQGKTRRCDTLKSFRERHAWPIRKFCTIKTLKTLNEINKNIRTYLFSLGNFRDSVFIILNSARWACLPGIDAFVSMRIFLQTFLSQNKLAKKKYNFTIIFMMILTILLYSFCGFRIEKCLLQVILFFSFGITCLLRFDVY